MRHLLTHKACSNLLNTFARGDVYSAFHCPDTQWICQGHFQRGSFLFWPHKWEERLNWEKGHVPNRWPPGPKDCNSKSEMSPPPTFFGLICHGNMILLTIFRGNWSNFFTFIALVIKPYWGFILFCILAFFPLSSCSVLNVGSSKGISKVGEIRRNLQNNWTS